MSWEVISDYEKDCFCGKGKIRVIVKMDDWNRTDDSEEILCQECRAEALRKEREEREESLRFQKLSNEVVEYFKINYLNTLSDCFCDMKSKKSIWETTYEAGIDNCSLNSFYRHNKNFNKELYIKHLISMENMENLIKFLNINDYKLNEMIKEPLVIHYKRKRESYNAAYRSYRKK